MDSLSGATKGKLWAVGTLWMVGMLAIALIANRQETITVVHWANGHMMTKALLPDMAEKFNREVHVTAAGKRIKVQPLLGNSAVMADEMVQRIATGAPINRSTPDPAVITPAAEHWLGMINYRANRQVIDTGNVRRIATTWIGIAMLREMAQCLGWPDREIGYADIVALRADPQGWATRPCAKLAWGAIPLLSFTDPTSSSTGRSMLFTLYAIAAGKPAEQLTLADVTDPKVVDYLKRFQKSVDHSVPDTLALNIKIFNGPSFGHFFFVGEENLVSLYQGREQVSVFTSGGKNEPLKHNMVMVYPKEGSAANGHAAAMVNAPWVTPEVEEASRIWVDYLQHDEQQAVFMKDGLRPATNIALDGTIGPQYGLDPKGPKTVSYPDRINPEVALKIVEQWGAVKNSGVVTFVLDTSGSMSGVKLTQAKLGVIKALDNLPEATRSGFLTFSDKIQERVPVGPITVNKFKISEATNRAVASGGTALYDAIAEAIQMTDAADADDDAIRGVVVLTDGMANGGIRLDQLITLISRTDEGKVTCSGHQSENSCTDREGLQLRKSDAVGTALAIPTRHRIHIFFVGAGEADIEVGRMLAEATGGTFFGVPEKDIARFLELFGLYF